MESHQLRAVCDRELQRDGFTEELMRGGCDGELGVMESWVRWRAGCDRELCVMESWV